MHAYLHARYVHTSIHVYIDTYICSSFKSMVKRDVVEAI